MSVMMNNICCASLVILAAILVSYTPVDCGTVDEETVRVVDLQLRAGKDHALQKRSENNILTLLKRKRRRRRKKIRKTGKGKGRKKNRKGKGKWKKKNRKGKKKTEKIKEADSKNKPIDEGASKKKTIDEGASKKKTIEKASEKNINEATKTKTIEKEIEKGLEKEGASKKKTIDEGASKKKIIEKALEKNINEATKTKTIEIAIEEALEKDIEEWKKKNTAAKGFEKDMLDHINMKRSQHYDTKPLIWNSSLATEAKRLADILHVGNSSCAGLCVVPSDKDIWYDYIPVELESPGKINKTVATSLGEKTIDFYYDRGLATTDMVNPWKGCINKHFFIIIYNSTQSVGCAYSQAYKHASKSSYGTYVWCLLYPRIGLEKKPLEWKKNVIQLETVVLAEQFEKKFAKDMLDNINYYRSIHLETGALTWSDTLATEAKWLAKKGVYSVRMPIYHGVRRNREYDFISTFHLERVRLDYPAISRLGAQFIDKCHSGIANYSYASPSFKEPGHNHAQKIRLPGDGTEQFIVLLYKKARFVGCAFNQGYETGYQTKMSGEGTVIWCLFTPRNRKDLHVGWTTAELKENIGPLRPLKETEKEAAALKKKQMKEADSARDKQVAEYLAKNKFTEPEKARAAAEKKKIEEEAARKKKEAEEAAKFKVSYEKDVLDCINSYRSKHKGTGDLVWNNTLAEEAKRLALFKGPAVRNPRAFVPKDRNYDYLAQWKVEGSHLSHPAITKLMQSRIYESYHEGDDWLEYGDPEKDQWNVKFIILMYKTTKSVGCSFYQKYDNTGRVAGMGTFVWCLFYPRIDETTGYTTEELKKNILVTNTLYR